MCIEALSVCRTQNGTSKKLLAWVMRTMDRESANNDLFRKSVDGLPKTKRTCDSSSR